MGELIGFELDLDPNIKDDDGSSSPRVEIDTSAPFGSVAEAVIRFGGHGFWIPQHLLPSSSSSSSVSTSGASAALNPDDIIDVVNKLDQDHLPTQILKDLTLKQQQALDVFMKELNLTKNQIKKLQLKLLNNSSSSESIPAVITSPGGTGSSTDNSSSLCAQEEGHFKPPGGEAGGKVVQVTSELNQAKLNLSQSTSELASIRTAVESLNRKLEQEGKSSTSLESSRNQQQQSSSLEKNINMMIDNSIERSNPPHSLTINNNHHLCPDTTNDCSSSRSSSRCSSNINNKHHTNPVGIARELWELNHEADQFMRTAEAAKAEVSRAMRDIERTKTGLKMIELRWAAAKKMEEAAHAAEQLALAEIRAISSNGCDSASSLRNKEEEQEKNNNNNNNKMMMISLSLEEYNILAEKAARGAEENLHFPPVAVDQNLSTRGGRGRDKEVMRKMALEQFMGRAEVADRRRLLDGGRTTRDNNHTHRRGRRVSTVQMMTRDCNNSYDLSSSFLSRNLSLQGGLRLVEDQDANEVNCGEEESRKGVLKPATTTTSIGDVLRRKKQVVWRDDLDLGRGREGAKERETSSRVSLNQMLRNHRAHNFGLNQRSDDHGNGKHLFWKKMKGLGFVHVPLPLSKARSRD